MAFSIFTKLYDHPHYLIPEHIQDLKKYKKAKNTLHTSIPIGSSHSPVPPAPGNHSLLNSMDLPILDISDRWNHSTGSPFWLASFSECVFKFYLYCSMYHNFTPFYGQIIFHCVIHYILSSIHQLVDI